MQIPNYNWHKNKGAEFQDYFGCQVPSHYGDYRKEYRAIRESTAIRDVSFFGKIEITGKDAKKFLHRMLSNDVLSLEPGQGVRALFLDIKGHVQADMKVYQMPDSLLILLQHYVKESLIQGLNRYIISEDVRMKDVTGDLVMFQIFGPQAENFLRTHGVDKLPRHILTFSTTKIADCEVQVIRLPTGFALLADTSLSDRLLMQLDAPWIGARAFDIFRMEQGWPLPKKDIQEMTFPQEARIDDALHFQKGCYLGQEVMARIDARGHVNRLLMGIVSDKEIREGDSLYREDREIGKITSAGESLLLEKPFGLGYVRREWAREGEQVAIGTERTMGIVRQLPLAGGKP